MLCITPQTFQPSFIRLLTPGWADSGDLPAACHGWTPVLFSIPYLFSSVTLLHAETCATVGGLETVRTFPLFPNYSLPRHGSREASYLVEAAGCETDLVAVPKLVHCLN